jgi:hypothetical protein
MNILVFLVEWRTITKDGKEIMHGVNEPGLTASDAAKAVATAHHLDEGFAIKGVSIIGYIEVPPFSGVLGEGGYRRAVNAGKLL